MKRKKNKFFKKVKQILIYLTNNEYYPRQEIEFDIFFLIVNTIAMIWGIFLLQGENVGWIPFLVIEYTWALDNMRHNRP